MTNKTGKKFIEQTYYEALEQSDQQKGLPQPPLQEEFDKSVEFIELPTPELIDLPPIDFKQLVYDRRSLRKYGETPLTLQELSYFLWCSQGVKKVVPDKRTYRTVPSAGARHAFETYLLVNNVESLKPGLYKFIALEHKLVMLSSPENVANVITKGCLEQNFVKTCAVTFIWTADVYRMAWRYGQRGYRYLHLDAGHVCQNLYLAAETINCGVCAIAAFEDKVLNSILNLDGENKFVIYLATAGKKES
jgi:SagB-type dehydrogenase family enzyme